MAKNQSSWTVSDELWAKAEPLVAAPKRDATKAYLRAPGGGRKPMEPRMVFAAIVFVLRTGIQWKALPKEFGSSSSVHRYFREWSEAGFFEKLWAEGLAEYDDMAGIATGSKAMLFGDFGRYYVRKVGGTVIGVLRERFWPDMGIAGLIRFDGEIGQAGAIKHLKLA